MTDSATDTPSSAPREALSAIDRAGEQGTRMLEKGVRDIACGWEQVASASVAPDVRGHPGVGRSWARQAARRGRAPSGVTALATARVRSWGVAPAGEEPGAR